MAIYGQASLWQQHAHHNISYVPTCMHCITKVLVHKNTATTPVNQALFSCCMAMVYIYQCLNSKRKPLAWEIMIIHDLYAYIEFTKW